MTWSLGTPRPEELGAVAKLLAGWQRDGGPVQLHPGDLGWFSMRGAERTAASLRTWRHGDDIVAIGLLDGPDLLRLALAPGAAGDTELALRIAADLADPQRGVLRAGAAVVEARGASTLAELLMESGWVADEPWTPFVLRGAATANAGVKVEVAGRDAFPDWGQVHWSAFRGTPFGETEQAEVTDWLTTIAEGPFAALGCLLLARDEHDQPVACASAWTAGAGRPGLIEPMGVSREHRGHGYGAAITAAAARALEDMGSSSVTVCAESSNTGAVATYAAAGFTPGAQVRDLRRP